MQDPYARHIAELLPSLSAERLDAYKRAQDRDALDPLARYLWNMALCEALYPSLQCLEVALRNTLHAAIAARYGTEMWFDNIPTMLAPRERAAVAEAKQKLVIRNKDVTAGRIVAELNFGFWTSLLDTRYETELWPSLLKPAFPYLNRKRRRRSVLADRFAGIRRLRNRVFHHEPIWYWHDLPEHHYRVLEATGWINPGLAKTVRAIDRFSSIYSAGTGPTRSLLEPIAGGGEHQ